MHLDCIAYDKHTCAMLMIQSMGIKLLVMSIIVQCIGFALFMCCALHRNKLLMIYIVVQCTGIVLLMISIVVHCIAIALLMHRIDCL